MTCTFVPSPLAGRVEKKCSREIEMYVVVAFCFVTVVNGYEYLFICVFVLSGLISERRVRDSITVYHWLKRRKRGNVENGSIEEHTVQCQHYFNGPIFCGLMS